MSCSEVEDESPLLDFTPSHFHFTYLLHISIEMIKLNGCVSRNREITSLQKQQLVIVSKMNTAEGFVPVQPHFATVDN